MRKFKKFLVYSLLSSSLFLGSMALFLKYSETIYVINGSESLNGYILSGEKVHENNKMELDYDEIVMFNTEELQDRIRKSLYDRFSRDKRNMPFIKRVSGKPGDTVCYTSLGAWVYRKDQTSKVYPGANKGIIIMPESCFTIPLGKFFLTGDHELSLDSRYFGLIDSKYIYLRKMKVVL